MTMTAEAFVTDEREAQRNATAPALLGTIRAARAGDSAAFEELMLLTERRVAQIAWRILGDAEEVKEAVQETFLRFYRHLGRYDERQDLFGWLTRITVNVCRDSLRRNKRRRIFEPLHPELDPASDAISADDELERRAELAKLSRGIDALPPKERMAVLLRDVEGMATADVAAALGNSVATVRVQLSKARTKLREWMRRKP
jgi:RNA polymerase sigma-70 factor (ECF subfamily)